MSFPNLADAGSLPDADLYERLAPLDLTAEQIIEEILKHHGNKKSELTDEDIEFNRGFVQSICPEDGKYASPGERNFCLVMTKLYNTNKYDNLIKERLGNILF